MLKNLITSVLFTASLFGSGLVLAQGGHSGHTHAKETININTASEEMLDKKLQYVGEKTAQRIVAHRKENGAFKSIEELTAVKGIGSRIMNANRKILAVE